MAETGGGLSHTEVITVINQLGLPIGLVIVLLYFGAKFVWPFFTKQIESLQSEREHSRELMMKMQELFLQTLGNVHNEITKRLDEVSVNLKDVASKMNKECPLEKPETYKVIEKLTTKEKS